MSVASPRLEEGKFGPTLRGGPAKRYGVAWGRIAKMLVGSLTAVALLLTAGVATLIYAGESAMEDLDVPTLTTNQGTNPQPPEPDAAGPAIDEVTEVLNVLVVGDDSREGLSDEELQALGTEETDGKRTDTMFLVQLDPRRDQVTMLSFPRDLLVTRCDGTQGRLNSAYFVGEGMEIGGPGCLVQTITEFSGIPIDHYIQVDFAGFIDVVDALGGVTFYLQEPITDVHAGVDLDAGCVTLTGAEAIGFVRARYIDNDFGRIARQQRFAREVLKEATSAGTLLNYPKLLSLVRAAASAVDTDRNLSFDDMARIAYSLRDLSPERLDTRTVPAVSRMIGGAAYVVATEEANQLFAAFRNGTLIPQDLGTEPPGEVTIADVPPVDILNGAGISGLAAQATAALQERGFQVGESGNADSFAFLESQVVYSPDRLEEAQLLAEALGGIDLVPGEAGQDLQLVLGASFNVTLLPTPSPVPSPPAPLPTVSTPPASEPPPAFAGAVPSDVQC